MSSFYVIIILLTFYCQIILVNILRSNTQLISSIGISKNFGIGTSILIGVIIRLKHQGDLKI